MSADEMPRARPSGAAYLARAAVGLYPPAWRARYGDEVRALIDDGGAGPRTVASLAWRAIPAWIRPGRQLHDPAARMRASLGTVLVAWTVLAGLAVVFVQLTQAQPTVEGVALARHPVIGWSYWVLDAAAAVSVLAVAIGGVPLWLRMLRAARDEHRRRVIAFLLAPVAVPAAYLGAAAVAVGLVSRSGSGSPDLLVSAWAPPNIIDVASGMVGPWWFLALALSGLTAGVLSAAGAGLALRSLKPEGHAVRRAAWACGAAGAAMALAGGASVVAAACLYVWAPSYHSGWEFGIYAAAVLIAAGCAAISGERGIAAARRTAAA